MKWFPYIKLTLKQFVSKKNDKKLFLMFLCIIFVH